MAAPINGLTAGGQDDFFIVFQFKYLDDNGKYIKVEDSRLDELRSYEENYFKPGDARIVNRESEKHSVPPILWQGPGRPDG
jgi:hypothetical protein